MNPDQNAYKEQVPPAPGIMSQLLPHSYVFLRRSLQNVPPPYLSGNRRQLYQSRILSKLSKLGLKYAY